MQIREDITQAHDEAKETSFSEVIFTLRRRRALIAITLILCLLMGIALAFLPRKYAAKGDIRVQPGMESTLEASNVSAMMSGEYDDEIASEVIILQSRTLYLRVAKQLNLVKNPQFWGLFSPSHPTLQDPKTRDMVYREMKKRIKIDHDVKNEIISISCTTESPALSAQIVNTLINDYVKRMFELHNGATQRTSTWLFGQLDDLKKGIDRDQNALVAIERKLGVVVVDSRNSDFPAADALKEVTKAASQATLARIEAEAKYRYLKQSSPNLIEGELNLLNEEGPSGSGNSLLQNLRNSRAQAAISYARLVQQFGPKYPAVREEKASLDKLNTEVRTEERRILNQARLSFKAASANERMTDGILRGKEKKVFGTSDDLVKYGLIREEYEAQRKLYESLVEHLREAAITSGMEGGEIDIVDLADLPGLPVQPGPVLFILGSAFAGLILGALIALLVDTFDIRIKSIEEAERSCASPIFSIVPSLPAAKDGEESAASLTIPAASAPRSRYAESMQSLRTALMLAKPGSVARVILVTSGIPGEGKSTTSINLAATLAQHHARVLLVDTDLRRGILKSRLAVGDEKRGLSEVLTGQVPVETVIRQIPDLKGLYVLTAGLAVPNPAVLTGSNQMRELIESLKRDFDFIVMDCPPVLGMSDALNLGVLADAGLFVVRMGYSNRKAVDRAERLLGGLSLPVLGCVLNDVQPSAERYGYGYGYGSYYNGYYEEAETQHR